MSRSMIKYCAFLVFLVGFSTACKVNHLVDTESKFYRMNDRSIMTVDSSISDLIQPYKAQLDQEMNREIGTVGQTLTKEQPESTLGNWFADLLQTQTEQKLGKKVDFAVVNYGGVRIGSIPAGPITKGKVFELMPFDNMVVVVDIDGSTLMDFFNLMAENGGWPISKTVKYEILNKKAKNVRINQEGIDPNKTYRVSMSDYVANGGSNCKFLIGKPQEELGIILRDVIIQHIEEQTQKGVMIGSQLDGRVKATQF